MVPRYGVPCVLHSEQGANLNSQVIVALCKLLGINKTQITAYHPQANGQVEHFGGYFVLNSFRESERLGQPYSQGI